MSRVGIAKTFNDRGAYIPLSTDYLRHARIRVNAQLEWDVLLSGLSGDKGPYIVPWAELPNLISLSLHDRALIEVMEKELILSPAIVREHVLSVNALGYDGANPMAIAAKSLAHVAPLHSAVLAHLMALFCAHVEGLEPSEVNPTELLDSEGQKRLQSAFISFSKANKIPVADVAERIEEWASLMTPCGFDGAGKQGYLLKTCSELAVVANELSSWITEETPESVAKTRHVMDALLSTHNLGKEIHERIIGCISDMGDSLKDWEATKTILNDGITKLSWLLDGWGGILDMWDKSRKAHRYQKRITVHMMMQFFPILPEEVLTKTQIIVWTGLRKEQLAWRMIGNDYHPLKFDQGIVAKLAKFSTVKYI